MADENGTAPGRSSIDKRSIEKLGAWAGILTLIFSAYIYVADQFSANRQITIEISQAQSLLASAISRPADIEIRYLGQPVQDPTQINIVLRNTGKSSIRKNEIEAPVKLEFSTGRIVKAELVGTNPPRLDASLKYDEKSIEVAHNLLNSNDSISFLILAAGRIDVRTISITARIEGISWPLVAYPDVAATEKTLFTLVASRIGLSEAVLLPAKFLTFIAGVISFIAGIAIALQGINTARSEEPRQIKLGVSDLFWSALRGLIDSAEMSKRFQVGSEIPSARYYRDIELSAVDSDEVILTDEILRFLSALLNEKPEEAVSWLLDVDLDSSVIPPSIAMLALKYKVDASLIRREIAPRIRKRAFNAQHALNRMNIYGDAVAKFQKSNLIAPPIGNLSGWLEEVAAAVRSDTGQRILRTSRLKSAATESAVGLSILAVSLTILLLVANYLPATLVGAS